MNLCSLSKTFLLDTVQEKLKRSVFKVFVFRSSVGSALTTQNPAVCDFYACRRIKTAIN